MKEPNDPKADGFMRLEEVVQHLASGWSLRDHGSHGYDGPDYWMSRTAGRVRGDTIERLIREGWVQSYNGGFSLTDEGHRAYMRSTDELGDGKLIAPSEGKDGAL